MGRTEISRDQAVMPVLMRKTLKTGLTQTGFWSKQRLILVTTA